MSKEIEKLKEDEVSKEETKRTNNNRPNGRSRRRGQNRSKESGSKSTATNKGLPPHVVTDGSPNNNISWYTHVGTTFKDVASLPFNIPVGTKYPVTPNKGHVPTNPGKPDSGIVVSSSSGAGEVVPGILTINLAPTIGVTDDPMSAANIAAQQIYTLDRKANSGAANYDKTDLMMVILAMDSAYMLFEELVRAYRLYGTYNYLSRYQPNDVLRSLGFGMDLADEYASFRTTINLFAYQLASINIPDQFDFIHRHSWLYTNVYRDSDDARAQLYAYVPDGFYVWTEGTESEPTYLKYVSRKELYGVDVVNSISQIRTAINKLMNPILGSQDVGIISGDLAKAFGEAGMIKIQEVAEFDSIQPVKDVEVINQMMNSTIYHAGAGGLASFVNMDVTVNNENLTSGPFLVHKPGVDLSHENALQAITPKMLNLWGMDSTPEAVMTSTRLMSVMEARVEQDKGKAYYPIRSCGTELARKCTVWIKNFSTGKLDDYEIAQCKLMGIIALPSTIAGVNQQASSWVDQFTLPIPFDGFPTQYAYVIDGISDDRYTISCEYLGVVQEINLYTQITDDKVMEINDIAVMSEFATKDYQV